MPIRVFIADDHPVVRDGMRLTIERNDKNIIVVGEAADGLEVLKNMGKNPADVYILDITMPNMNGIATTREILKRSKTAKVIILSLHDTRTVVEEALSAGAYGYLSKEMATRYVVDAVNEVSEGRNYLCPKLTRIIGAYGLNKSDGKPSGQALSRSLTRQENMIVQLIVEGLSNKEISAKLHLSVHTVRAHRSNLMSKLGIHKQVDLFHYAIKAGLAKL